MKTLIIKTVSLISFLFLFLTSRAAEGEGESYTPWYKEPWAWIVPAAIFAVLIVAYIMTGEKKSKNSQQS